MSHLKERDQKNCLNCNAVVEGRYCGICGQENLEPQESVWHLFTHFFNDITHFDGKFFSSLKYLMFRPGFLALEYMSGRRASYLNPIRMYIFTSFFFFFIFFTFISGSHLTMKVNNAPVQNGHTADSILKGRPYKSPDSSRLRRDSIQQKKGKPISLAFRDFRDKKQYDSLLKAGIIKDGFIMRALNNKMISLNERYGNDSKTITEVILDNFKHRFPQVLFLSLPLVALVLKLLHFRRKKYYYVSHAIFTIQFFSFTFITTLVLYGINALSELPYMGWLNIIFTVIVLSVFLYLYKAMRYFYGQRRGKTILKYFLLLFSMSLIILLAMIIMFFYSFYKS